ncbi:MAG: serine/threonine protein kinase [Myxococcales bacterium]|nr:serine/threonine protein kinase [Myxococcales bacterium]
MDLPARFGKFILKRKLARGGMAEVFLAGLPGAEGFEKELVVKLILPELSEDEGFVRRFVDEAKTCVRLTHPNIVSVFELGVEAGVLYMAMELVRGATLTELLGEGGKLDPDEGAYLGLELARALHHAHKRGVLHRDVTPGNVMLDEDGAVKLLDFGIAAPVHDPRAKEEIFGTPGYMPLEQMEGGKLGPSTDLFALGAVLVEAWTGHAPYRRADAHAARTALLEGEPARPSFDVAALAPVDDLVLTLLAREPTSRPQHADDVARVLRQFLGERGADHDDVAVRLGKRVARALLAREAGRSGPRAAVVPYTMRPTPFAERTRTFATRGEPRAWTEPESEGTRPVAAEGTRRLDEPTASEPPSERPSGEKVAPPAPSTRRIEPEAVTSTAPSSGATRVLVALGLVAVVVFGVLILRRDPPTTSPTDAAVPPANSEVGAASVSSTVVPPSTSPPPPSTKPSTTASVAQGTLVLLSSPPARIEIDGKAIGETPKTYPTTAGEHRVVFRPRGLGESFERKVTLPPSGTITLRGDFNDEPRITVQ